VLTFIVAAALLTLSPGPDTMLVLRNTLRGGRVDGWRTTLGICLGLLVHATLSSTGLSLILVRSAALFSVVKMIGAAYLVWLGLQSIILAVRPDPAPIPNLAARPRGRPFRQGVLTNALNPKVAIFYLAFLPQFIAPGDPVLATSLLLASIHIAMGLVWLSAIAFAADRAQRYVTDARVRRWIDGVCGAVLVALGIRLALARR
jgi:RhtB (resistance to homoserine/threonine) family protein